MGVTAQQREGSGTSISTKLLFSFCACWVPGAGLNELNVQVKWDHAVDVCVCMCVCLHVPEKVFLVCVLRRCSVTWIEEEEVEKTKARDHFGNSGMRIMVGRGYCLDLSWPQSVRKATGSWDAVLICGFIH